MKVLRKIIQIDEERCDGCGLCATSCAEGALAIVQGKAKVVKDSFCDGLGACIGECPKQALTITERVTDEFDEVAVTAHLSEHQHHVKNHQTCPSATPQQWKTETSCACESAQNPRTIASNATALTHWPIQIRLIPKTAPFLKKAHLLILADCCAVALPNLHKDVLQGKVVMMGCPKFDPIDMYVQKFKEIFEVAGIQSLTTVVMEVPCCSGLPAIVQKGMSAANCSLPINQIVVSAKGHILSETTT
ncbi:MAG: 4Fe-4S binding protein [Desulfobacterales bacterium]|nr:4Fe-4S binding protein [Desulfobacterales bacterium]